MPGDRKKRIRKSSDTVGRRGSHGDGKQKDWVHRPDLMSYSCIIEFLCAILKRIYVYVFGVFIAKDIQRV